ncbi:hypothetical protein, partial [Neisseria dentiae]|uniref:hypothetical protein n=1 Tax=Neisseria dentiae TaxID=194197 RepID=UPI0035A03C60
MLPETFAKFKLLSKKSDFRHSRAGGNPDAWYPSICLIDTSIFPSGFPPARERQDLSISDGLKVFLQRS